MTPKEFRDEIARKGWTSSKLAKYWGFGSRSSITAIINDPNRRNVYDCALAGLPKFRPSLIAEPLLRWSEDWRGHTSSAGHVIKQNSAGYWILSFGATTKAFKTLRAAKIYANRDAHQK